MTHYQFDERLAYATTIPASWYLDEAMLAREQQQIFERTWQLVGHVDQVASPNSFFTTQIGNEPIVVTRAQDNNLRAFSNVCRHRAGSVARGAGQRKLLQCGYHGWTYTLEGKLQSTPEFQGVECFNKADVCLPQFQVETWCNLIFVNIDRNAPSLSTFLEDLPERVSKFDLADTKLAFRKDWYVECNWKVYVDNYLEGYHIPLVHPGLNKELDYQQYRTETRRYYSTQHAPLKRSESARIYRSNDDDRAEYFWIFPNLMLNVYPNNFSTNLIVPLGPHRTLTVFEWYFRNPTEEAVQAAVKEVVAFSDEVQLEDISICETVQRNLRSRHYQQGRYSVSRENGVHHFHGLLNSFLGNL